MTTPEHKAALVKADAFCRKRYGCGVRDLGFEPQIAAAVDNNEDVIAECIRLGEKFDLDVMEGG